MPYKIVVTGPESCGKTSLCTYLSSYYKGKMISEYSRDYLAEFPKKPDTHAIEFMGLHQEILNNQVAQGDFLIFCDTDALNYQFWLKDQFAITSQKLEKAFRNHPADLYLLCFPDIPWTFDLLRQNPNDRKVLFKQYWTVLNDSKLPIGLITGKGSQRINRARFIIDNYFSKIRTFNPISGVPNELIAG